MQVDLALAIAQFLFSALILTYLVARLQAREKETSVVVTYAERSEGNEEEFGKDLPSIDAKIVNYLRERGGSAYQSEIGRDLKLPKSTLHRAVTRLETMGVVRVRKMGRRNLVELSGELPTLG